MSEVSQFTRMSGTGRLARSCGQVFWGSKLLLTHPVGPWDEDKDSRPGSWLPCPTLQVRSEELGLCFRGTQMGSLTREIQGAPWGHSSAQLSSPGQLGSGLGRDWGGGLLNLRRALMKEVLPWHLLSLKKDRKNFCVLLPHLVFSFLV